jgi:DedD protein
LPASSREDGFHEIQLNGKQLVFLFMAATVVSVVIFLCGVLVGRGVRTAVSAADEARALSEEPAAALSPAPFSESDSGEVAPGTDPRTAPAPPAVDDLTYFSRLEQSTQPAAEELKPAAIQPAASTPPASTPPPQRRAAAPEGARSSAPARQAPGGQAPGGQAPAATAGQTARPPQREPAPVPPRETPSPPVPAESAGAAQTASAPSGDWVVQVAALNVRSEAEAVARRFASRGYAAFVATPGTGTSNVFRVRIGPFRTRNEADSIAVRLEKEERIKPWVTR